jgi:hypothetical protein
MPDPNPSTPPPDPLTPATEADVKKFWLIALGILALIGWVLSGFFGYSYKQVSDAKSRAVTVHSEGVTITKWQEIGGKAYPVTIVKTVHDSGTSQTETKVTTTIRSGVSVGVGYSTKLEPTGLIDADLFPLGPGNVQVWATGNTGEQVAGGAYRFNF